MEKSPRSNRSKGREPSDAQMLVLCALLGGPQHGYAINTSIQELTGERLGAGSLYGALTRLEGKGLVESLDEVGRQRPVRITAEGQNALEQQLQTMARIADYGLTRLSRAAP